jgi:pyruvate,water dikinase
LSNAIWLPGYQEEYEEERGPGMENFIAYPQAEPSASVVGNKAATLSHLQLSGFPVPGFFCVTTTAYQQFVELPAIAAAIEKFHAHASSKELIHLTPIIEEIRQTVLSATMPDAIAEEIKSALQQLYHHGSSFSVRSSATAEDSPGRSFAGLYRTFLNVKSETGVLDAVKACWASLWTVESVYMRQQLGIEVEQAAMAVIIQVMIEADASGVIFTEGPVSSQKDCFVVNAVWGLGEGIVSGSIAADLYLVKRDDFSIVRKIIALKEQAVVADALTGISIAVQTGPESERPALTDDQLVALARVAWNIEQAAGRPQDIEWCMKEGQFFILQSRPITGFSDTTNKIIEDIRQEVAEREPHAYWQISNNIGRIPLVPFAQSVWSTTGAACERASATLALRTLSTWGIFHDYIYVGERRVPDTNETPEQRAERSRTLCDEYADKWESEFRAEVETNNKYLNELDLEVASASDLVGYSRRAIAIWQRHWEIHNIAMSAKKYVADQFTLLFKQLFGQDEWRTALRLLQGFENTNLKINSAIWELAQMAARSETVLAALEHGSADECLACLRSSVEATDFLRALESFLQQWGNRIVGPNDLMHPSWRENPAFLFMTIMAYIKNNQVDPTTEIRRLEQERIEEEHRLLEVLADQPATQEKFARQLRRAQTWPVFLEDHNYLIEQTLVANIRRIALELGQRLSSVGVIAEPQDVFFLTLDQIAAITLPAEPPDLQALVKGKREIYESKLGLLIPQTLGTPLEFPAASKPDAEDFLAMIFHPDPTREMPLRLIGIPASPGYAQGPARIINDIDKFSQVQPGDILVCQRTTPPWTPLFSIIAGLVTNAGSGVLQHSAINAREFGIPAVLGTQVATEVIQPGQIIAIDGVHGYVELAPMTE